MPKHYYILPMTEVSLAGLDESGLLLKPVENHNPSKSHDFLENLRTLRADYISQANIAESSGSPSSFGLFFGYQKNTFERYPQIEFIEKMLAYFDGKNENKGCSREDLCILVSAALFIRQSIRGHAKVINHSLLYKLLGNALGLSKDNIIDPHTEFTVYQIANAFIRAPKTQGIDTISDTYKQIFSHTSSECKSLSESFANHIAKQRKRCLKPDDDIPQHSTYPITIALSKAVGDGAAIAGWSAGAVAGDFLARTTGAMPVKAALTAGIGSAVCLITGAGPTVAIALAAPTVASKLISTFSSVSMAYMLGALMKVLGNLAGAAVGFPLDVSVHLACQGAHKMYTLVTGNTLADISGIRLVDGKKMICGIEFTLIEETHTPAKIPSSPMETIALDTHNGQVDATVDGQRISADFIEELKNKLSALEKEQFIEERDRDEAYDSSPVGSL